MTIWCRIPTLEFTISISIPVTIWILTEMFHFRGWGRVKWDHISHVHTPRRSKHKSVIDDSSALAFTTALDDEQGKR